MSALALLLAMSQPVQAAEPPPFWTPEGPPAAFRLDTAPSLFAGPQPTASLRHGPDTSSGADVPAGGFKYKKKKKPVLSYVGGSLTVVGLLYLAGSRTAGFEADDAATQSERDALLQQQSTRRTVGVSLLGTAGACFVLDIFI